MTCEQLGSLLAADEDKLNIHTEVLNYSFENVSPSDFFLKTVYFLLNCTKMAKIIMRLIFCTALIRAEEEKTAQSSGSVDAAYS